MSLVFPLVTHGKRRQIAIMVEKQVELDGTFGPSDLSPVEQRKGQVDDAGIQAHELVFEPELFAGAPTGHAQLALCQELLEHSLVERPGAVRISVGESGALWEIGDAHRNGAFSRPVQTRGGGKVATTERRC
jgi:hypothetical protein